MASPIPFPDRIAATGWRAGWRVFQSAAAVDLALAAHRAELRELLERGESFEDLATSWYKARAMLRWLWNSWEAADQAPYPAGHHRPGDPEPF